MSRNYPEVVLNIRRILQVIGKKLEIGICHNYRNHMTGNAVVVCIPGMAHQDLPLEEPFTLPPTRDSVHE
jgi:hypothetical protein